MPSDGDGIDDKHGRPMTDQAGEVADVEGEDLADPVDVSDCHEAGVVDLLTDDTERLDRHPPRRVNRGGLFE